jgi:hypothetical protein
MIYTAWCLKFKRANHRPKNKGEFPQTIEIYTTSLIAIKILQLPSMAVHFFIPLVAIPVSWLLTCRYVE